MAQERTFIHHKAGDKSEPTSVTGVSNETVLQEGESVASVSNDTVQQKRVNKIGHPQKIAPAKLPKLFPNRGLTFCKIAEG